MMKWWKRFAGYAILKTMSSDTANITENPYREEGL